MTSGICFYCGPLATMLLILSVFPGLCVLQYTGSAIVFGTQYVFMGFYQLSRLYYCFSIEQVHHDRGYPLWLFIIMTMIGGGILMSWITMYLFVDTLPSKCGFTSNAVLFWEYRTRSILFDADFYSDADMVRTYYLWNGTVSAVFQLWDIGTLSMYCWKIYEIGKIYKSKDDGVWRNSLCVLHRIVIVTVFYQITSALGLVLFTAMSSLAIPESMESAVHLFRAVLIPTFYSVLISLCMFMMMEHNTTAYIKGLHCLRRFHLDYLCFCCCGHIVKEQLKELDIEPESPTSKMIKCSTLRSNPSAAIAYAVEDPEYSLETMTRVNTDRTMDAPSPYTPST